MFQISIEQLIKRERFIEAIYFGALDLAVHPSSELHLFLGVACCASIRSIAETERFLALEQSEVNNSASVFGLGVCRDTSLVKEGLHHLLRAKHLNPSIMLPDSLEQVTASILQDLRDYTRQEFRGFSGGASLRTAAFTAIVMLCELQGGSPEQMTNLPDFYIEVGRKHLAEYSDIDRTEANFYKLLSEQ
jgi:hypothetical protein